MITLGSGVIRGVCRLPEDQCGHMSQETPSLTHNASFQSVVFSVESGPFTLRGVGTDSTTFQYYFGFSIQTLWRLRLDRGCCPRPLPSVAVGGTLEWSPLRILRKFSYADDPQNWRVISAAALRLCEEPSHLL